MTERTQRLIEAVQKSLDEFTAAAESGDDLVSAALDLTIAVEDLSREAESEEP